MTGMPCICITAKVFLVFVLRPGAGNGAFSKGVFEEAELHIKPSMPGLTERPANRDVTTFKSVSYGSAETIRLPSH